MARKKKITNRTLVLTAVVGSLLIVAMVSCNTLWLSRQSNRATEEAVSAVSSFYLDTMADRRARTITNLINNSFDEMEKAVAYIEDEEVASQDQLRGAIGKMEALLGLRRFALVDRENIVYTQYTTYTGGSRHSFLSQESIAGRTISTVSLYGSSKQLCLAIPTTGLSLMGRPFKGCFVQFDIRDIVDLLAFDDQEETHFALYSKNGGNLSDTELGPVIQGRNLFDAIRDIVSEDSWQENRANFENEAAGTMTLSFGEGEETLCYVPIPGTGWEMAVLVRENVIQDQIRDISEKTLAASRSQIMLTLASASLLALVLLHQSRRIARDRIAAEQETSRTFHTLANTDSLTGVRNKHAYSESEAVIDQQIRAGELEKLAVVVGDINGLKHVNDTQGHAAGDQLIRDACALICDCFPRGAVFRIGGDEFVVVLQGKGYDTMPEAVRALNRRAEENLRNNGVVVSIGYSVLKREDQSLGDVFERADQMMYARKKKLKKMGG